MSLSLTVLVATVIAAGGLLFAYGVWNWQTQDVPALLVLVLLAMAAERFDFDLYGDGRVSLAFVPIFAALLLSGLPGLALVAPLAIVASAIGSNRPPHKTLFNFGALMLAGAASLLVLDLSGSSTQPESWPGILAPALLAAGVNFTVNSTVVTAAIALSKRASLRETWNEHFQWLGPHYLVMGLIGLALIAAYRLMGHWGIAVFLAPPLMMRLSLKQYLDHTTDSVLQLRLANERLRQRQHQLLDARAKAVTDGLTGLRNHRAFHEQLRDELDRAEHDNSSLGLIMLDIDGFKAINDSQGHLEGDRLLRDLAASLTEVTGHENTYRYGGDEFAILLRGTDRRQAIAVAERLRRAVESRPARHNEGITVSLGVACFPHDVRSAQQLIYQADAAMYWAKSAGKNRVGNGQMPISRTTLPLQLNRHGVEASGAVTALTASLKARDPHTSAHMERCSRYAIELARELKLNEEDSSLLRLAAFLHDIGKLSVPETILFKPGPLDESEWAEIKLHPAAGAEMLRRVPSLAAASAAVLHHHEHFDGSGYPDGLARESIPVVSRILLVIDAFDAMTTDRPYRKAMAEEAAIEELRRHSGTQFDPAIVQAFLNVYDGHRAPAAAARLLQRPAPSARESVLEGFGRKTGPQRA